MSQDSSQRNKRIAKNTLIVNIRLFVTMAVGLLTSRYVLQALGASDYGLYNVMAGILSMITFIASSMSSTTTRFINYEIGKPDGNVNRIFNVCQVIHIIMAVIILIIAESVGIWYINNYLNVEPGRESDAMFVFQVSTITACVGITNAPYQGLLVANERFATMAKVEVSNSLLKLGLVFSLFLVHENILRVYSLYMSVMTAVTFICYHWICYRNWNEIVKWNVNKTRGYYKGVLTFNNYNLLAAGSMMLRDQGVNMLVNFFFGTVVNAAYAIARTIQSYVNSFMANFDSAAGPQITQSISANDTQRSEYLTIKVGKICILIALIAVFPLLADLEFVLRIWLGNVPKGTVLFSSLTLILVLVGSTSAGLTQIINGSGKIKWFKIEVAVLYVLCLPLCVISYKLGANPVSALLFFIAADAISRIIQLILLKKIVGFNSIKFVKQAYTRPAVISFLMIIVTIILYVFLPSTTLFSLTKIVTVFFLVVLLSYYIGLTSSERETILSGVKSRLHLR